MKTLSVIPSDNVVVIDGVAKTVDCSSVDATINAIQFNFERMRGHVEFIDDDPNDSYRKPNEIIEDVTQFEALINAWGDA